MNLNANPVAKIQIGSVVGKFRSRQAMPEELERYWPRLVQLWPAYQAHFERSGRRTVFILLPVQPKDP